MNLKTDVVIIGGSLAGATCARELARRGIDAIAVERDVFPRAKVCGGFLSPNAVECLDRLGLLPAVRAAGAVDVDQARVHAAGIEMEVPFRRPGLGVSRNCLDEIVARDASVEQGVNVINVAESDSGFLVETNRGPIYARILVDAAGKLSRFTQRVPEPEFGVQYFEADTRGSALDFWFFEDGYGGGVTVEGSRSNFCFLIRKRDIERYASKPEALVTGPLAYQRQSGSVIAIGDAAGMIDPFCGEGMFHALDSGVTAAFVVARGLRDRRSYAEIRQNCELQSSRRWSRKRLLAQAMRQAVRFPQIVKSGLGWKAGWFLDRLWDRMDHDSMVEADRR